jgi:hypothetical protein
VIAGMAESLATVHLTGDLLFGVSPTDLETYILIPFAALRRGALCDTRPRASRHARRSDCGSSMRPAAEINLSLVDIMMQA